MRRGGQSDQPSYRESADQSQFHRETPGAQVVRMQMLPAGMPGRYNFRVIITKYICQGTGNTTAHRLLVASLGLAGGSREFPAK
jgi:hypothetical protein